MNPLTPDQVGELVTAAPAGSLVHLVGIAGCGMCGLGHLLLDRGFNVQGSDLNANEETRRLEARGARVRAGHDAAALREKQVLLVAYSSAIRADNPELMAAVERRIPVVRRATLLAALLARQRGISVAGMHGKTTTAALLAFALDRLGVSPSYAVGGTVPQLERPARWVKPARRREAPWFVAETDESDGTLREFRPEHAIVLNVDAEHLDYFADLEAVCREFQGFVEQTRGEVVFCADDARLAKLMTTRAGAVSYGCHALAEYRIGRTALSPGGGSEFEVWHRGRRLGGFQIALLGERNIANAVAVIALLDRLGFDPAATAGAIAGFRGVRRRQELLFADHRFRVYDDYGHHPTEVKATVEALRSLGPRRLLVAFQPHRYTRTQRLLDEFTHAFGGADRVWVTGIYAAGETPIPGIHGAGLSAAIRSAGQAAEWVPDLETLRAAVREAMEPGDTVVFLGAGDITEAGRRLATGLGEERPARLDVVHAALAGALPPTTVLRRNEPMARRTTLRVGGPADLYVEPASEGELAAVLRICRAHDMPVRVLGRGSNLLVLDRGIRGVVVSLADPAFSRLEVVGDRIHCGAGVRLKAVAHTARQCGLAGLEFLEGIPGSVGGGLRMNAGAMGSWMFESVETLRYMDPAGEVHERSAAEIQVEYRGCPLLKDHIALGAVLKGQPTPRAAIEARMQSFNHKRWDSQPAAPSAGCIFKNPKTIPAGKLIDELGLKGTRVGGAVVSELHGNFIVNDRNATARDVLGLIEVIRQRARSLRGIELETEVEILGE